MGPGRSASERGSKQEVHCSGWHYGRWGKHSTTWTTWGSFSTDYPALWSSDEGMIWWWAPSEALFCRPHLQVAEFHWYFMIFGSFSFKHLHKITFYPHHQVFWKRPIRTEMLNYSDGFALICSDLCLKMEWFLEWRRGPLPQQLHPRADKGTHNNKKNPKIWTLLFIKFTKFMSFCLILVQTENRLHFCRHLFTFVPAVQNQCVFEGGGKGSRKQELGEEKI